MHKSIYDSTDTENYRVNIHNTKVYRGSVDHTTLGHIGVPRILQWMGFTW